ncbi:uncharacterized protein LOC108150415 isoform X2 [Drosophila elegans]|uniref:uncharacterized protein LOC108150415 isoform X2 n=1 Tax=Drosophila elegans TaxID=30023 RepID=UPI001BC85716|nr:uncharacterized protein LOC108150415 isoform X2 [Drosophila elegans]
MAGLNRRLRTAQQILLRRALNKSVGRCHVATGLVPSKGDIVDSPSVITELQPVNPVRERSSSRAVRKIHRFLAANPLRILQERKAERKLPGCELQRKDSRSWRKLKPSEQNPTVSGHSLKLNGRDSTRSRHSSSTYPSTWQLNVSRAKEIFQDNSQGSLEEILNCSILNRTPYDHKLSIPLKSDNSCQCTINKKSRRRGRKTKGFAEAQTQTTREIGSKLRTLTDERNFHGKSCDLSVEFQKLRQRVYSGEDVSLDRKICISPSKTSAISKATFKCEKTCPGKSYKNYGGYSPSETDIETEAEHNTKFESRSDYLNKIEKISKPPSNADMKRSHQYISQDSRENEPINLAKYEDQNYEIQRKNLKCLCKKAQKRDSLDKSGRAQDTKCIGHCSNSICTSKESLKGTKVQQYLGRSIPENGRINQPNFQDSDQKIQRKHLNCFCTITLKKDNPARSVNKSFDSLKGHLIKTDAVRSSCRRNEEKIPSQDSLLSADKFVNEGSEDNFSQDNLGTKQMDQHRYNQIRKLQSPDLGQVGVPRRYPYTSNRCFRIQESRSGSLEKENERKAAREKNSGVVICAEAITQTSEYLLATLIPGSIDNSQGTPFKELNHRLTNSVKAIIGQSNQDNFKQVKSDKADLKSQQNQVTPYQVQCKPLEQVQSESQIIYSDKAQYQLIRSSSVKLKTAPEIAPKTKKAIHTRTRKCSQKRSATSEKTKKQKSKNRECKSVDKDQNLIGGMSNSDKSDVWEILNVLQKTVAGLEKQINIKKKLSKGTKSKYNSSKRYAQLNEIQNRYVNQSPTQTVPDCLYSEQNPTALPLGTFQEQPNVGKIDLAKVARPTIVYQTTAYRTTEHVNAGNPTNMYKTSSVTNFSSPIIYQNNTIPRVKDQVPYKEEGVTKETEYDYHNQEPSHKPIRYIDDNHEKITYCINPQCNRNNHQMEVYQKSAYAKTPLLDSAYNQVLKHTTNSGGQNQKEVCKGPKYCPYRSQYRADHGPTSRGVVTFQDCEKMGTERSRLESFCDQRHGQLLKGGTAWDFCENPHCPENNTFKNDSTRIERKPFGQELRGSPRDNPNCPHNELVSKTFTYNHQKEPLYEEELHECPGSLCQRESEEDSSCLDSQECFDSHAYNNRSYPRQGCTPNCLTRPKSLNQDDKRQVYHQRGEGKVLRTKNNPKSCRVTNENSPQCPEKITKKHERPRQDYQNDHNDDYIENAIFPEKNTRYTNGARTNADNSPRLRSKGQPIVGGNDSCPEDCPNLGSFTHINNRYKQLGSEICDSSRCPKKFERLSNKDPQSLEKRIRCRSQRYEADYKVCESGNCSDRRRMIEDQNKYSTYADTSYRVEPKRKYNKQLCKNPKCHDKKGIYGYTDRGRCERNSLYKKGASIAQRSIPNDVSYDPEHFEEDPDSCTEDCYNRKRYHYINDRNNCTKQETNDFEDFVNPKCSGRLKQPTNYKDNRHEMKCCENQDFPDKLNGHGCPAYTSYRGYTERKSKTNKNKSIDQDLCSADCPNRRRVLFTDLLRFKRKQSNPSRQSSGRSEVYVDNRFVSSACNKCKRYVPLESDRLAIKKYCDPCNTKGKRKTGSVESIVLCIRPGRQSPIFVKNRDNPLLTNPVFNSYEKHILEHFDKLQGEKNKLRKCSEDCPFIGNIEEKNASKKRSSGSRDKIDILCYCQSEELIEHEDSKKKKSKISFLNCEKSAKDESKSKTNLTPPPQQEESKPKRDNKSSEFSCFKPKDKYPQEMSKPREKPPSKSNKKKSKSSGFLCFKKTEKPPQENQPKIQKKSQNEIMEKPSGTGVRYRKESAKKNNDKIQVKDASKKSLSRSVFISWCRKSQTPKESSRKEEKAFSDIDCTCSKDPETEDIPMPRSEVPFRCPCAPENINDDEVKVLYDSSFRFQKESCSCAEVPKNIYCHNSPQQPEPDTSDWYESSRQQFYQDQDQDIKYCPCASANDFYKILR